MRRPSSKRYLCIEDLFSSVAIGDFYAKDWMVEPANIRGDSSRLEAIKEIRNQTGIGMIEVRRAMVAANWDIPMAIRFLKKGSIAD